MCRKSLTNLSHNVVSSTPSPGTGFKLAMLVMTSSDFTGRRKSYCHTITTKKETVFFQLCKAYHTSLDGGTPWDNKNSDQAKDHKLVVSQALTTDKCTALSVRSNRH